MKGHNDRQIFQKITMIPIIHSSGNDQTIVALCSPEGRGAIALIRLSGDDAFEVADRMSLLAGDKKISQQKSHSISYGWVIDDKKNHIDQVLFLIMHGPTTFTGQNVVEITCHNNRFLIEQVIDRALACGARIASRGEFTRRAVMLGKIDLLQAEAIDDLIHAQNAQVLKYSLSQLEGSLSAWINEIELAVIEMLAFCEASFEFIDEGDMEFAPDVLLKMKALIIKIEQLLRTFSKQQYIKEGVRIALVGSVNAGKSSLFNCLLDKKRAIVTPIPGTTRDSIEAGVFRGGDFITFIDTAGIRKTNDEIEQEGIDRSFQEAHRADLILLVVDDSEILSEPSRQAYQSMIDKYDQKIILVYNKIDIASHQLFSENFFGTCVSLSAQNNLNVAQLFLEIEKKISVLKNTDGITCLLNNRHYDLLTQFLQTLRVITPMLEKVSVEYELVSYRLRDALSLLSEMTGRSVSQATIDKVFQSFCVGK